MILFQGLFLLLVGAGLVGVAYRGLATGWLPCGPNIFKGRFPGGDRERGPPCSTSI